jgi:CheY-like chemotaxis protein
MRILLVDDHAIVRSGLRNLLASVADTQIFEAATGQEAQLRLRQDRPDLVLLDLNLPGIGGLELLRQLLQEDKEVRILVLSMHAEPDGGLPRGGGKSVYRKRNCSGVGVAQGCPWPYPAGSHDTRHGNYAPAGLRHEPD